VKRPSKDNPDTLAERLIKACGSKRAAYKAIEAAKTKGEPTGRPPGSPYLVADAHVLFVADVLQTEYRAAKRPVPTRRKLIAEAYDASKHRDSPFAARAHLGASKRAVVERLANRPNLAAFMLEHMRRRRPDLMRYLPDDAEARIRSMADDPSNVNFGTMMFGLGALAGFLRRYPGAVDALATEDARAGRFAQELLKLRLGGAEEKNPSGKAGGN
jgi:hypothetical protein